MNLLSLISSWLDIIYQVTMKCTTVSKPTTFHQLISRVLFPWIFSGRWSIKIKIKSVLGPTIFGTWSHILEVPGTFCLHHRRILSYRRLLFFSIIVKKIRINIKIRLIANNYNYLYLTPSFIYIKYSNTCSKYISIII